MSSNLQPLHDAWNIYNVRKKLGVTVPPTTLPKQFLQVAHDGIKQLRRETRNCASPIKNTLAIRRSAELAAALDCIDWRGTTGAPNFVAVALIDEYLCEARNYARGSRSLFDSGPSDLDIPKGYIRTWRDDLRMAMPSKINPLCDIAELTIGGGRELRSAYEALESDLRQRTKKALVLDYDRAMACRAIWDDFVIGVDAWCQKYESLLAGRE